MTTDEVLYTCPDSINPHPYCTHPQRTTGDILRARPVAHIEFDSSGEGTFMDCWLKINGEPVCNVMGFNVDVQPGGMVVTTVQFEGGPVNFKGTLYEPGDEC